MLLLPLLRNEFLIRWAKIALRTIVLGQEHAANFSCRCMARNGEHARGECVESRTLQSSPLLSTPLTQPLPVRVRQRAQDSILCCDSGCLCCAWCLVPCAFSGLSACGSLHAGHANATPNTMPNAKVPKTNNNNSSSSRRREKEGQEEHNKNAAHIRTRKTGN